MYKFYPDKYAEDKVSAAKQAELNHLNVTNAGVPTKPKSAKSEKFGRKIKKIG